MTSDQMQNARRRVRDRQRRLLNAPNRRPAVAPAEPEAPRDQGLTGIVTFLNGGGRWGFIRADGLSYFFHQSCLEDQSKFSRLTVGDHVVFEPGRSKKGPRAECVRPL